MAPEVAAIGRSGRNAVIQLLVRTAALRAIGFLGTLVLARLLSPEDFGLFAVVIFLVAIIGPLGDLGLAAALIQQPEPPTDSEVATAFTVNQMVWLILLVVTWIIAPAIRLVAPGLPADVDWMIRVTALAVVIRFARTVPAAMMTRVLRFAPLATIDVAEQVVYFIVALVLAYNGAGVWSFLIALLAQFSVGTALVFLTWRRLPGLGFERAALRRMMSFAVPLQVGGVLGFGREAVVPLFGGLAGGVAGIGYLQFGQRLGRMVGGVDEVIGQVAFPAFSRIQGDRARLSRALLIAVESAALLIGLVLFWSIAVAPTLIPVLFTERWDPAIPVFQLSAVAVLVSVPGQFLRGLIVAAGDSRSTLVWGAISLVVVVVSFPILLVAFGLVGGGIAFVLYSAVLLFGYGRAARAVTVFPWARLVRIYSLAALAALVSALSLALVGGLPGLIMSGLVFTAIYGVLLFLFERGLLERSWRVFRGGDYSPEAA